MKITKSVLESLLKLLLLPYLSAYFSFSSDSLCLTNLYAETVTINGAGASFPYPVYTKWFSEYQKEALNVKFNYQPIGSSGGVRQLFSQTVDFAASDVLVSDKEIASKNLGWNILQIPTVLGSVVVVYNLSGFNLKIDGNVLAQIFKGKISKWNDPQIASLNHELKLPNKEILVIHRSDGSGTTEIFTSYLSIVNQEWKRAPGSGKALSWPTGIGAKGNDGISTMIKQTPGSIGYVEYAFAINNNLPMVAIKNVSGKFIIPSINSMIKAASALKNISEINIQKMNADKMNLLNASGDETYPITSFTYLIIPIKKQDEKENQIKKFVKWALSIKGQNMTSSLNYAPLPAELSKKIIDGI
ncbi:MAG: phosphate ABC transporter substrate-binding protein PstS [Oligoflexia bacterium]|nr:phosphate ABC transporter substrate-binding protein PstS [Oligoflexia bacterium]